MLMGLISFLEICIFANVPNVPLFGQEIKN